MYPCTYKWMPSADQLPKVVDRASVERLQVALFGESRDLVAAEKEMLQQPQMPCPVVHHFGPGVYMREVTLPAGALAIGHAQKREHMNIMLRGKVLMFNDDGSERMLEAPMTFTGKPGRKVGYVLEDVTWLNVYATDEKDIDVLEATYLDKSESWSESAALKLAREFSAREVDRLHFDQMIDDLGIDRDLMDQQVKNEADQIPMPDGWQVRVHKSPIDGFGLFASSPFEEGQPVAPARIGGMRTPAGRYTNHSATPNARMVGLPNGDVHLIATRHIEGCRGGDHGEEITIDYRQALALSVPQIKDQS